MGMRNGKAASSGGQAAKDPRRLRTAELFCGIGGFRLAADTLGLETVWANDICPKACEVYRDRFPGTPLHQGDLRELTHAVPTHDLLTAGFPCQPFSSAGKKEGIRDPRGTLFQLIVDVLARCRPRCFVLENVKRLLTMERGHHFATILSSLASLDYRLEWRLVNAMHLGLPQNRQRVFLIGVRNDGRADRRKPADNYTPPAGSRRSARLACNDSNDIRELVWQPIVRHGRRFPTWGLAEQDRFLGCDLKHFAEARGARLLADVLQPIAGEEFDFTERTRQWIGANTPVNRLIQGVEILSNQGGGARMGYTIFGTSGVAPTLTSTTSRHYERYLIGDRYRRLTNIEYARIQGFPDDHCRSVSVYDQYALYGNAVPPPMAQWALEKIRIQR